MGHDDDINTVRGFLDGVEGKPEPSAPDVPGAYYEGFVNGRFARSTEIDFALSAMREALPQLP